MPQPPCVYTAAETIAILGSLLFAPAAGTFRDMIVLAVVCGVFAGFAARRFLSARDAWDFWRLRAGTLPGLRGLFFRDARRCVGWALGAVVLLFLVVHLV
jgi:hypothetical protein